MKMSCELTLEKGKGAVDHLCALYSTRFHYHMNVDLGKLVNQIPAMDQNNSNTNSKTETKSEKPATKHLRSEPPGKIKLPGLHKPPVPPPPVKEKPIKIVPRIEEPPPISPKQPPVSPILKEDKEKAPDQFDGVDVSSEKLSHPTANRAKPPQRRPPTALATASNDPVETDHNGKSEEKDGLPQNIPALPKVTENPSAPPNKMDQPPKTQCETKPVIQEDSASLASVLKVLKDLRMSLDLLKNQHERDIQELKDELKDERGKRMRLQDEVEALRKK